MKLLYLHDGQHNVGRIASKMGFDVVKHNIDDFVHGLYTANQFDVLWVNLSSEIFCRLDTSELEYVLDDLLDYFS